MRQCQRVYDKQLLHFSEQRSNCNFVFDLLLRNFNSMTIFAMTAQSERKIVSNLLKINQPVTSIAQTYRIERISMDTSRKGNCRCQYEQPYDFSNRLVNTIPCCIPDRMSSVSSNAPFDHAYVERIGCDISFCRRCIRI